MQSRLAFLFRKWLIFSLFILSVFVAVAQINETVTAFKFGPFNVTSARKEIAGKPVLYISIYKGNTFIVSDSVITDAVNVYWITKSTITPIKIHY